MLGIPDSCGIWAPCLSYNGGRFYLIYTIVKRYGVTTLGTNAGAVFRDLDNYLVTSETVDGEWSDPVFLNSSGFDPSLFHDDDGRKYLLNMLWDHRPGRNRFAGIVLQQYSEEEKSLIGERSLIFAGTSIGLTEAPHLYRRNGYYYLLTAEGGTGWGHAVTMARSRAIGGPYELHPNTYILTSRHRPDAELQRAGHADLVETQHGETYMVHLCGRPLRNRGRCTLGRETAIQRMKWCEDDWLRTADPGGVPVTEAPAPDLPEHAFPRAAVRTLFESPHLPSEFQWLRTPWPSDLFSMTARPGRLRMYGLDSPGSLFRQSLVARRQEDQCFQAATCVEFEPQHFQQLAGLIYYYNSSKFHYVYISRDETMGRYVRVMSCLPDLGRSDDASPGFRIPDGPVELRIDVDFERLRCAYRVKGEEWRCIPQIFDASIVSDEAGPPFHPNFTGAFVGVCCQDLAGTRQVADFEYFEYSGREYRAELH
jgi:xylan 1,4-beta-xylosidase